MRSALLPLAEAVEALEAAGGVQRAAEADRRVPTGWAEVDEALAGGLARAAIHEWLADPPPLLLLAHLAQQALTAQPAPGRTWVIWVGRECWPYGHILARPRSSDPQRLFFPGTPRRFREPPSLQENLLARSLFVDTPDNARRLWVLDVALRCPSVAAVVGDGRALDMAATRRLQLAARAGGALGLLARPPTERAKLSAAATRWGIEPTATAGLCPRWRLQLWRCKGLHTAVHLGTEARTWELEWDHAQGLVPVSADLAGRSAAPALAEEFRRALGA